MDESIPSRVSDLHELKQNDSHLLNDESLIVVNEVSSAAEDEERESEEGR
jgi:hypothetical protein